MCRTFEPSMPHRSEPVEAAGPGTPPLPAAQRPKERSYRPGSIYKTSWSNRLFFTTHLSDEHTYSEITSQPIVYFFSSLVPESYRAFCDDNGPIDIAGTLQCCREIHSKVLNPALDKRPLVFYTYDDPTCVTNSVLVLCAYLVIYERHTIEQAYGAFEAIRGLPLENFRDATYCVQTFRLTVCNVLRGLLRAIALGWLDPFSFDTAAYRSLHERPRHDVCVVTPKFVALATPKDVADEFTDARPATAHVALLRGLGVTDLVRLNEKPAYAEGPFTDGGIVVHALAFADCSCPSAELVGTFLDRVDSCEGVVAVHCLAGLGRTGTMIACHMIKHHGFSAAEAIGYLRLMRPGSVIGPQQHFLERVERCSWAGNRPLGIMGPKPQLSVSTEVEGEADDQLGTSARLGAVASFSSSADDSTLDASSGEGLETLRWSAQDMPDSAMEWLTEELERLGSGYGAKLGCSGVEGQGCSEFERCAMARNLAEGQSRRMRMAKGEGEGGGQGEGNGQGGGDGKGEGDGEGECEERSGWTLEVGDGAG